MKVQDWLSPAAITCRPEESLQRAAQLLWENDLGAVPVVDGEQKLVGILTDRDLCMAAFTRGSGLHGHSVASAMSKTVYTLAPKDSLAKAHALLRTHQIRRAPVVDTEGVLVGVLTLGDLALESSKLGKIKRRKAGVEVAQTLAAIVTPRAVAQTAASNAVSESKDVLQPAVGSAKKKAARTPAKVRGSAKVRGTAKPRATKRVLARSRG